MSEQGDNYEKLSEAETETYADAMARLAECPQVLSNQFVLIAARQLYTVAVDEMEKELAARTGAGGFEDVSVEILLDGFVQAAAATASQPFSDAQLLQTCLDAIVPWLKRVLQQRISQDAGGRKAIADEFERGRRSLPIRFKTPLDFGTSFERDQGLVLVGQSPLLRYALRKIADEYCRDESRMPHVVYLTVTANPKPVTQIQSVHAVPVSLTEVGLTQWRSVGTTLSSLQEFWQKVVVNRKGFSEKPDLLVVEDGLQLLSSITTGSLAVSAAEVQKGLKRFCKELGCGLLLGIPTTNLVPSLTGASWQTVSSHSLLRPVWLQQAENGMTVKSRVMVGRDTCFGQVLQSDLYPEIA